MNRTEKALVGDISESVSSLLPALEEFARFSGPDGAADRATWRPLLDEPLPARGAGAQSVLATLKDVVIPRGSRLGHPGFSGWITTMPTTTATAAALAATWSAPQRWWVHPANFLDVLAARWLGTLLGLPSSFQGVFVSGGAMANLIGLGVARQHAAERQGLDASRDGVGALREPRVYASSEVHHVLSRAAGVLGLGRRHLRTFAVDAAGKLDLAGLESALTADTRAGCTPVALVASAGDVNTGRVDPIPEMVKLARRFGVWLHVDGAYGGFGVLDERVRHLYGNLADVDSLAIDPHKWLAVPVGCGACFVRDSNLLGRAFTIEPGEYVRMQPPGTTNPGSAFDERGEGDHDFTIDFSTPSRGLAVWAVLKEIGAEGMAARVKRHLDCARRVAELCRESPELELLAEPVLSICCFRYRPPGVTDEAAIDGANERVALAVRAAGRCTPSTTRVNGRFAIRPCFINPRTELADAEALVAEVLRAGRSS